MRMKHELNLFLKQLAMENEQDLDPNELGEGEA